MQQGTFEIIIPGRKKNAKRIIGIIHPDGCWEVKSLARDWDGYIRIKYHNKDTRCHRVVYQTFNGPIPDNYKVRHTCHHRYCNCPDHLIIGTHKQNMEDKKDNPEEYKTPKRLSTEERTEAQQDKDSTIPQMASKYDVSLTTIKNIRREAKLKIKPKRAPSKGSVKNEMEGKKKIKKK